MANPISRAWRAIFSAKRPPDVHVEQLPRLGPGGPVAGVYTAPNRWGQNLQTHPLIGSTPNRIDSVFRNAVGGRPCDLMDLLDDARDRAPRLDAVCRTRTNAITGRPWGVEPPPGFENDDEAKDIARKVEQILRGIRLGERTTPKGGGGWRSVIAHATDGIFRMSSTFEIEWGVDKHGQRVPKRMHWRHPNRMVISDQQEQLITDNRFQTHGFTLDHWGDDKFAVHSPTAGRATYLARRGVLMSCLFPVLFQRSGYRWWIQATERWGMPIPVLEHEGKAPTDEHLAAGVEMMRKLTAYWNAVLWGGWKIRKVEGTGSVNPQVYTELIRNIETFYAIQVLGQNMTTEVKGGSHAAAKVSNFIRLDILIADLVELDDWVTWQIIEPIVRYNWPGAPMPMYVTEWAEPSEVTVQDVEKRIARPDERRKWLGLRKLPDGEGDTIRDEPEPTPVPMLPPPQPTPEPGPEPEPDDPDVLPIAAE